MVQQPQPLVRVVHHRIRQRRQTRVGEQPDHLGEAPCRRVPVVGVEQNEVANPARFIQREVNRVRARCVMTGQPHPAKLKGVEHGAQFTLVLRVVEGTRFNTVRAPIAEPIHPHHLAWRQQRSKPLINTRVVRETMHHPKAGSSPGISVT